MPDMLVRLYDLPDGHESGQPLGPNGTTIRRPRLDEQSQVVEWVRAHFTDGWAAECAKAFAASPPSCFVAHAPDGFIGFACHDCTRLNYFGPTGVVPSARGQGIGRALLLACLRAMHDSGYAYAIIGGVGPAGFYAKSVGAMDIAGSTPGIYRTAVAGEPRHVPSATRMTAATPKLASADMERSVAFYERLGFARRVVAPEFGIVARDAVQLHFWRCDDPIIAHATGCRIDVAGIVELFTEYSALGIIHPNGSLRLQPWGYREFSILDADGNLVTFAERTG